MKHILWVFVVLALAWLPLAAQDPSLPIRRLPDGKPDLSGVYSSPSFANKSTTGVPPPINEPMIGTNTLDSKLWRDLIRPGAEKQYMLTTTGDVHNDDPTAFCQPYGFPQIATAPYSQQIVQPPGYVVIFYEFMRFFKIIPMGAPNRPHSDWDGEPTYMGHSIGWWDGDTLVVDTIGAKEWRKGRRPGVEITLYRSDALHVVERFTPVDAYRINYQMTWDDPKVFTKPWTSNPAKMHRQPTWKLLEYDCQENNRCIGGQCTKADVQN